MFEIHKNIKGVQCTDACPLCENHYENECHLFLRCRMAKEVWDTTGLWSHSNPLISHAANFVSFFFTTLSILQPHKTINFDMMMWSIWKRRNEKIWDDVEKNTRIYVQFARDYMIQLNAPRQQQTTPEDSNNNTQI